MLQESMISEGNIYDKLSFDLPNFNPCFVRMAWNDIDSLASTLIFSFVSHKRNFNKNNKIDLYWIDVIVLQKFASDRIKKLTNPRKK